MIAQWPRRNVLKAIALTAVSKNFAVAAANVDRADLLSIKTQDGRTCNVWRWRAKARRGTILFSHGALSAPWKYVSLIAPWVAAGFDVWAPLHVDSTDHPETKNYPGLASWSARMFDLRALADHVGATRYVAAGHSYGALVALAFGGASPLQPAGIVGPLRDRRVRSVVAFSPPGPGMGLIDLAGYATLAVPAFIQTGTADIPPGAPAAPDAWRTHLAVFEAGPADGDRFALVLDGADHYFGGLICRPELPGPKQVAQLGQAIARSTQFLRAYGLGNEDDRRTLFAAAHGEAAIMPGLFRRSTRLR